MVFKLGKFEFIFFDKYLHGLFGIHYQKSTWKFWTVHFLCRRKHRGWMWGYDKTWYDGNWLYTFGLGPFFLISWV